MSPIDAYRNAFAEFEQISTQMQKTGAMLARVADSMQHNPKRLYVDASHRGTPVGKLSDAVLVDTDAWPDASRMAHLVKKFHAAKADMTNCWACIPPEDRSALKSPID